MKTIMSHLKVRPKSIIEMNWTKLYYLVLYILLQNCLPPLLVKRLIEAGARSYTLNTRERGILLTPTKELLSYASSVFMLDVLSESLVAPCLNFRLRLHERDFKSTRFHDLQTASKKTRFRSVHTKHILLFTSVFPSVFAAFCTRSTVFNLYLFTPREPASFAPEYVTVFKSFRVLRFTRPVKPYRFETPATTNNWYLYSFPGGYLTLKVPRGTLKNTVFTVKSDFWLP